MSGTTSAPGVKSSHGPLMAEHWPNWISQAPSLMWKTLSAIWMTCSALVGTVTVPLAADSVWPRESSINYYLSSPPGTCLLRYNVHGKWYTAGGVSYCVLRCELTTSVDFPYLSCCKMDPRQTHDSDSRRKQPRKRYLVQFLQQINAAKVRLVM